MSAMLRIAIERQFSEVVDEQYASIGAAVIRWARGQERVTLSQMIARYQDALARSVGYWK